MPRRKKHPKLPNGYGQIRYLGKGRRNPYGVYPPAKYDEEGKAISQPAICYTDEWLKGVGVLTSYKAGTYKPGDERELAIDDNTDENIFVQKMLADYNKIQGIESEKKEEKSPTFSEVYEEFYKFKFESKKGKKLSYSSHRGIRSGFNNCEPVHDKPFASLTLEDLQQIIDDCKLKHSSLELIVSLIKQMYRYAPAHGYCDETMAAYIIQHIEISIADDDENGIPFTEDELKILWKNKNDDIVEFILIMCYSGYRISAYENLKIDLDNKYFQGGVKTQAGKNRIVPIHSAVLPLVKHRLKKYGCLLTVSDGAFRERMYITLKNIKIEKHTPQDCRHTFSYLCEKYKINENDRKRMLGHSFGKDITNKVYGHRDIEELRVEIEKIPKNV
jgi:integrase